MFRLSFIRGGGSSTVTVSVDEDTDYIGPDDASISINAIPKSSMTPADIQKCVQDRQHTNVLAVGDLFPLRLDGTVGICDVSGDWYTAVIGINHNKEIEGDNTVHFQFPYNASGIGLAFIDTNYNTYQVEGFIMNPKNNLKYPTTDTQYTHGFNEGGWTSSYANVTLMPQFYNAISLLWRNIISIISKQRDEANNATTATAKIVQNTSLIWYLSEWEIHGERYFVRDGEQNYQKQYDYYKNSGTKVRYRHIELSKQVNWRLASVTSSSRLTFTIVNGNGNDGSDFAANSLGSSPAFAIAA